MYNYESFEDDLRVVRKIDDVGKSLHVHGCRDQYCNSTAGDRHAPWLTVLLESLSLGAMDCAMSATAYSPSKVPCTSGSMYCGIQSGYH